jgi:hypothetical protein
VFYRIVGGFELLSISDVCPLLIVNPQNYLYSLIHSSLSKSRQDLQ